MNTLHGRTVFFDRDKAKIGLLFQFITIIAVYDTSRGARAQSVTVKPTDCGFDPDSRRWNIYLKFIFPFSSLWCRGKSRRWVLPLNKRCLQNSAESGERSVLTLDSLCLPCCVRDTAWSWFFFVAVYYNSYYIFILYMYIDWLNIYFI